MTATHLDFDKAQAKGMKLIRSKENHTAGLLIVVGINLGLRISDLLTLTYGDLRKNLITLKEGKTGKERELGVNDNIKHAMSYFDIDDYPNNYFAFRSQKSSVYSNKHVNRLLKQYFNQDNVSSHTLRKTFGRRVYNTNGKSEDALMYLSDIFNHSSLSITRRYLGITREEINNIYMTL